jgi:hypothetical protein
MLRNVPACAKPDAIMLARMVEKLDQAYRLSWPTNQAIVQRDAHDFRSLRAFFIEQIEAIGEVGSEVVSSAETVVLVKTIVIGLERKWDDKVVASAVSYPERRSSPG